VRRRAVRERWGGVRAREGVTSRALADRWGWPGCACTLQPEASPSGPSVRTRPAPRVSSSGEGVGPGVYGLFVGAACWQTRYLALFTCFIRLLGKKGG
jgi:hypothetical protein